MPALPVRLVLVLALAGLALGCGDDVRRVPDTGSPGSDAGGVMDGGGVDAATGDDAGAAVTSTLMGEVTRTAEPRAGGVGHLYIGVFDQDPVTDRETATVVGRVIVENADMSASGARIPYAVEGIPARAEPYYVSAFLDDNMNAGTDPATAGPDRGDLVTLDGLGSPSVTVPSADPVTFEIVLNTNLPF